VVGGGGQACVNLVLKLNAWQGYQTDGALFFRAIHRWLAP
jgi:hypothetical protein